MRSVRTRLCGVGTQRYFRRRYRAEIHLGVSLFLESLPVFFVSVSPEQALANFWWRVYSGPPRSATPFHGAGDRSSVVQLESASMAPSSSSRRLRGVVVAPIAMATPPSSRETGTLPGSCLHFFSAL